MAVFNPLSAACLQPYDKPQLLKRIAFLSSLARECARIRDTQNANAPNVGESAKWSIANSVEIPGGNSSPPFASHGLLQIEKASKVRGELADPST